jgi:hypothetical protein
MKRKREPSELCWKENKRKKGKENWKKKQTKERENVTSAT